MNKTEKKAVFLDRDGVINGMINEVGAFRSPRTMDEFTYEPGVADFVKKVKELGYVVAVITNQPEVKRGLVTKEAVMLLHEKIRKEIGIEHFFVCWHDNEDQCQCRKPKPGRNLTWFVF